MGYFLENWGSFVGLVGIIISTAGLLAALVAMRRAGKARDAAEASETASRETRDAITGALVVVELQRAIALIQRIKVLLREERWGVSLEHYQPLRAMLADINGRYSFSNPEHHQFLNDAMTQVTKSEEAISEWIRRGSEHSTGLDAQNVLNAIQSRLEQMAGSTGFSDDQQGG